MVAKCINTLLLLGDYTVERKKGSNVSTQSWRQRERNKGTEREKRERKVYFGTKQRHSGAFLMGVRNMMS